MALKKPGDAVAPTAAQPAPAPKFEENTGTTVADKPTPIPIPEQAAATAGVAASMAIAKAATTAVAKPAKFEAALTELRDVIPAVDFGTFPRLVGSNGNVMDKDGALLGQFADITLLSWNETFVASPGDDSDEAKKLVRYSRDGVTLDDTGERLDQYLEVLRTTHGYKEALKKKYIELVGILEKSEKPCAHVNQIVQISLSPQSLKSFEGYRANVSVAVRLGKRTHEGAEKLRVTPQVKSGNGKTWTLLKVEGTPAA